MDMTSEELLEHYRDVQEGKLPAQIRGVPVWSTPEKPLFKGWAFRDYLLKPFLNYVRDKQTVRVLDHGCGKATYLHDPTFFGETLHRLLRGRLQSYYCYDPGFRTYMVPPSKGAKFDVIISAGVLSVIPEADLDNTLIEIREWCEEDGIVLIKLPALVREDRCFIGTDQSVYINVKPLEYWLEKFDTILQRRYYVSYAEAPNKQIIRGSSE